jgi:hypothetical protein
MMKFVAICEGTRYPIWAAGESEEEAKADLWERVHNFLVNANAPETSEMSSQELEDFFGVVILDLSKKGGYVNG